jgi:hypothetical protein
LAHDPDRDALDGLATASAQEKFFAIERGRVGGSILDGAGFGRHEFYAMIAEGYLKRSGGAGGIGSAL